MMTLLSDPKIAPKNQEEKGNAEVESEEGDDLHSLYSYDSEDDDDEVETAEDTSSPVKQIGQAPKMSFSGKRTSKSSKKKKSTKGDRRSKFAQQRNELKERIVRDVMAELMPDIGSYNIDGMPDEKVPPPSRCVMICKALGCMSLNLHEAVLSGSIKHVDRAITKIMKTNPLQLNQYDFLGRTALSLAVKEKNDEIIIALLNHKDLVPDIMDEATGRTPLMFSIQQMTFQISKVLIQNGASVHLTDLRCITPLMIACSNGDMKHAVMILSFLPEVDAQDENGWTALHHAVFANSTKCIELLFAEAADRSIRDFNKRLPLHLARHLNYGECVALLEDAKSRIAALDDD